jgi:acyl-CoA synthetase (AMP-forming)/AMP-acid ligase II
MSGYLGEPGLTRRALDGPWLRTGDRAIRDPDGHLRFTGWDKAIVKTLGLVVDREEVRAALLDLLPDGARVRLSARPRPRWGHQYAATVICPGSAPAMDELRARLAVKLSFYKIPDPITVDPAGLSSF